MAIKEIASPARGGGFPYYCRRAGWPGHLEPWYGHPEVLLDSPLEQSGEEAPNPGFQCLDFGLDFVELLFLSDEGREAPLSASCASQFSVFPWDVIYVVVMLTSFCVVAVVFGIKNHFTLPPAN